MLSISSSRNTFTIRSTGRCTYRLYRLVFHHVIYLATIRQYRADSYSGRSCRLIHIRTPPPLTFQNMSFPDSNYFCRRPRHRTKFRGSHHIIIIIKILFICCMYDCTHSHSRLTTTYNETRRRRAFQ